MRYRAVQFLAVPTGDSGPIYVVPTIDDPRPRVLKEVYVNITTVGAILSIYNTGTLIDRIDCARFGNGNVPVQLNESFGSTISFTFGFNNLSGGALAQATITVAYDA